MKTTSATQIQVAILFSSLFAGSKIIFSTDYYQISYELLTSVIRGQITALDVVKVLKDIDFVRTLWRSQSIEPAKPSILYLVNAPSSLSSLSRHYLGR